MSLEGTPRGRFWQRMFAIVGIASAFATRKIGGKPFYGSFGFGSLWVTNQESNRVERLDRTGKAVASVRVGGFPVHTTVGAGAVEVPGEQPHHLRGRQAQADRERFWVLVDDGLELLFDGCCGLQLGPDGRPA